LRNKQKKKDPLQTKFENAKEAILLANRDGQILSISIASNMLQIPIEQDKCSISDLTNLERL
jgi:hypothetical protein